MAESENCLRRSAELVTGLRRTSYAVLAAFFVASIVKIVVENKQSFEVDALAVHLCIVCCADSLRVFSASLLIQGPQQSLEC